MIQVQQSCEAFPISVQNSYLSVVTKSGVWPRAVCLIVSLLYSNASVLWAQTGSTVVPMPRPEPVLEELQKDLSDIFADPKFSNAFWGVTIQSMDNGQYLYRQ